MQLFLWLLSCAAIIWLDLTKGHRIPSPVLAARLTDDLLQLSTVLNVGLSFFMPLLVQWAGGAFAAAFSSLGVVLVVSGLWIRIKAMTALGLNYRLTPQLEAGQAIVSTGYYRLLRHPGYLGLVLQITGLCLIFGQPIAIVGVPWLCVCVVLRIRVEEGILLSSADYKEYAQTVRWRVVPGLW